MSVENIFIGGMSMNVTEPRLTRKFDEEYGFYIIYLDGKYLATRDNFSEVREVYAEYGITI